MRNRKLNTDRIGSLSVHFKSLIPDSENLLSVFKGNDALLVINNTLPFPVDFGGIGSEINSEHFGSHSYLTMLYFPENCNNGRGQK